MKPVLVLLVCCLVLVTGHESEPPACTPDPDIPGPPIPQSPSQIISHYVFIDVTTNTSRTAMLYFDYPGNRFAKTSMFNGSETQQVFNFNTAQMFEWNPWPSHKPSCHTVNLTEEYRQHSQVPYTIDEHGRTHVLPLSAWLHDGPTSQATYNGTATIRGIPVNHWYFCNHVPNSNLTYQEDVYYTVPGYTAASGLDQQPVRFEGRGKYVHNILDFFQWERFDPRRDKDAFAVDIYCPGSVSTRAVPDVPDRFSLQAELMGGDKRNMSLLQVFYDHSQQMYRLDGRLSGGKDGSVVIDFNTGIQYNMDAKHGSCTVTPIRADGDMEAPWHPADIDTDDSTKVRMKSPVEMFHFDDKGFMYAGESNDRDIPTDLWVSREFNYHVTPGSRRNSTEGWHWHFSKFNLTSPDSSSFPSKPVPVALVVFRRKWHEFRPTEQVFHIFNFKTEPFSSTTFDVSVCFKGARMKQVLYIKMTTGHSALVHADEEEFKVAFLQAVLQATGLSRTRIPHLSLHGGSTGQFFWMGVTMLERANVTGNSVDARPQKPLQTAIRDLKTQVQENRFKIEMNIGGQPIDVKGVPGQVLTEDEWDALVNNQPRQAGLRTGEVAGIAVGAALLGLLLGVAAVSLRRKGALQAAPSQTPLLVNAEK